MDNDGQAREIVAQENGTRAGVVRGQRQGLGQARRQRQVIRARHRRRGRQQGWTQRHPDAARLARSAGGPARRQLGLSSGVGIGERAHHAARNADQAPAAAPTSPPAMASLGFMHVLDVNGDGRNDVITAAGHDYGVFWFEQGPDGQWTRRIIDNAWSQGHASTLVDLNGDGRLDLVTGKRFMAHNGSDPGEKRAARRLLVRIPACLGPGGRRSAARRRRRASGSGT